MPLKIYNTLAKDYQIFEPLNPPKVNMYVCGITPYDDAHLGHGRAYVVFDCIRRYLELSGYNVNYIQNITDIDDKIIKRANELKISINELTSKYIISFYEVMDMLHVKRATSYPKATEHIADMIKMIEGLVKKGYAYPINGDVYFEVAKFKDYGKLSKRKLDDMKDGARVAIDDRKKSPLDFALWKTAKEGEPSWDSPWGKGRPGWHIECSAMSTKYLGETFDIHGGGLDLIFPHHENEIAQAECYTGKSFAKYWIHNGFVNINSEKMSKSLGNFFTLKDIFKKYDPMLVRFYFLMTHYRGPINFSDKELEGAKGGLDRYINALSIVKERSTCSSVEVKDKRFVSIKESFIKAMDSDFNTAEALSSIFKLCDVIFEMNADTGVTDDQWAQATGLFESLAVGVLGLNVQISALPAEISKFVSEMKEARQKKDYKKSDEIKSKIVGMGYSLEIAKDNEIKARKKV
jgi:cysteinyl-tRNA synthetase